MNAALEVISLGQEEKASATSPEAHVWLVMFGVFLGVVSLA